MDDVELVKQKLDIADVIGNYIPIKRAGRNFKAVCPFHNEKSPSFVISPERQIWHCFGCNKGGDIFTFVEEYERMDFSESLKLLADKAGIKLTKTVFASKKDEKKARLFEINHLASQFYNYLLTEHPSGKKALIYVTEKRKLTPALIRTYLLGFAPRQSNALIKYLINKKHYSKEELIEAGVATIRNGRIFDFFQNRIIFPITDARGNVVAFSGRGLRDDAIPKYINTKETTVYIKGDTLFGLYQAKDSIKKEGKVILMEGEFDVITSFKEGITNVVAVKGTALTENQIRLLKRFAPKIVFCFDTDPAGTEAQRRSIALITHEGINASVVVPPSGKDADEVLNENPLEFKKALKNEINIYDFILETASENEDPATIEGKKHILDRTLSFLTDIDNEIVKEHYLRKLAKLLNSSYESVVKEVDKLKTPQKRDVPITLPKNKKSQIELLEEHMMTLIFQSPTPKTSFATASNSLDGVSLTTPTIQKIFEITKIYFQTSNELNISQLTKMLPPELINQFDLYFLTPLPQLQTDDDILKEVEKIAKTIKKLSIKEQLRVLSEKMKDEEKAGNEDRLQQLRVEFNTLASHFK